MICVEVLESENQSVQIEDRTPKLIIDHYADGWKNESTKCTFNRPRFVAVYLLRARTSFGCVMIGETKGRRRCFHNLRVTESSARKAKLAIWIQGGQIARYPFVFSGI
jgi:hypothetical protein